MRKVELNQQPGLSLVLVGTTVPGSHVQSKTNRRHIVFVFFFNFADSAEPADVRLQRHHRPDTDRQT